VTPEMRFIALRDSWRGAGARGWRPAPGGDPGAPATLHESRSAMNRISGVTMPAWPRPAWWDAPSTGSLASIHGCGVSVGRRAGRWWRCRRCTGGGVVQVEVLAVGQIHSADRDPQTVRTLRCTPVRALDRARGDAGVTVRSSSAVMANPPYAGITRTGSCGRRHLSRPLSPLLTSSAICSVSLDRTRTRPPRQSAEPPVFFARVA